MKLKELLDILELEDIDLYEVVCNGQLYDYNRNKDKLNNLHFDYKVKKLKIRSEENYDGSYFTKCIIIVEGE